MRSRTFSIRAKIVALVAVPLTALLALWIFATSLTVGPAMNLLSTRTLLDTVANPGEVLVIELQKERRLSVEYLATAAAPAERLRTQRATTDRAATEFRRQAGGDSARKAADANLRVRIQQMIGDLDSLAANRTHIDRHEVDPVGAQGLYNNLIDTSFQMFSATEIFNDERIDREVRALITVGRGQEYLSRADSLLAGANATGKLDEAVRAELVEAIGTSRFLLTEGVNDLPDADRTTFQQFSTAPAYARIRSFEDTLVRTGTVGAAAPVTQGEWQPAFDTAFQQLRAFQVNAADSFATRAKPLALNVLLRLGLAAVVGLIALIISIVVSIRVGRSIIGRLIRLRREALQMADERLPTVVRRLQRGEAVDVDVETPPLEYGRDEIGQLGHAFNEVQRTAVQSAVDEATVRRGINEVFLNIARRSQTLLHRQLALLDRMEHRETGPDELEDLYRVDHLATRMRRHAEDLVILAGAAPGRGWRNPVPVIDVLRGAISEVEDYKRIDIRDAESSAIAGRAVGDVIHLLAELFENASSFSPPHTRVEVTGQVLPNGYAVEIEDRGLGMTAEALDAANHKLIEPPDFDPADSARLGLFVVAQLAHRHGIGVSLRASAYGGITAVVLIPGELVTAAPAGPKELTAGPSWDRPQPTGRTGSTAALQWQGTEELRTVTLPETPTGPAPTSVTGGLSTDGLVQRRRTVPRRTPPPGDRPSPQHLADTAAVLSAKPAAVDDDGLPKRVRQASLAPQLRAPVEEETDTVPSRSPEQVRSLMSALQRGTTQGRLAASGATPEASIPAQRRPADPLGAGHGFADAETISFPVVQNRAEPEGSAAPGPTVGTEPREIIETAEIDTASPDKDA